MWFSLSEWTPSFYNVFFITPDVWKLAGFSALWHSPSPERGRHVTVMSNTCAHHTVAVFPTVWRDKQGWNHGNCPLARPCCSLSLALPLGARGCHGRTTGWTAGTICHNRAFTPKYTSIEMNWNANFVIMWVYLSAPHLTKSPIKYDIHLMLNLEWLSLFSLATFRLQEKVAQICFFFFLFFITVWAAQTTWNLIFSILIWNTLTCGPKSDTGPFCNAISVWSSHIRIYVTYTSL